MLKKFIGLGLLSILLTACGKPLPVDKQNYSGTWQSEDGRVNLMITSEGRVEYSNKQPNSSSSVSAPISKFEGNNFSAGIGPLSTEFKVSQAPQQTAEGSWTMTVDGHVLNKVN
ncbi:hypothetical protein [Acinetobacter sp.]|jgi:hypothetical protein|uniref:Lipoprotein n=1 Tax=Acinetobacter bereziniae TaxID=106648 RepID=A0A833PGC8_ACIBZ|nr:hypothetical protein [Acinetobacter sp.]KAF1025748.1 MAG: hypothetical protein GAK29_01718 [Acinetobacter bereziniae]MDR0235587.1 hypothetical protein [Acinetobacter sp.]